MTPPSLWMVHGEISNSPTFPVLIKKGLYAGQFLVGDISAGGIKRAFVEKIGGAYQGVAFSFTGGLEVGIETILEDSSGVLYRLHVRAAHVDLDGASCALLRTITGR